MSMMDEILPLGAFSPVVLALFLSTPESIDKLVKGLGSCLKFTALASGNFSYGRLAVRCSQGRSLLRTARWWEKLGVVDATTAMEGWMTLRNLLFVLRVLCDILFIFFDNASFYGGFVQKDHHSLATFTHLSRTALFWGYVAALIIDLYDAFWVAKEKRKVRLNKMAANTMEIVCGLSNVCSIEVGALNVAVLSIGTSLIGIRDQLIVAHQTKAKKDA